MKLGIPILFSSAVVLAGCGGSTTGPQSFSERFEAQELLFAQSQSVPTTNPGSLPTGTSAVYTGVMGMTIDVDGILDLDVTTANGDFRAAAEFTFNVNFSSNMLTGTATNFSADELHTLSGTLTISPTPIVGSTFVANYAGTLILDNFDLVVTNGTTAGGQFKGSGGQLIWGNHTATVDWLIPGGSPSGSISGGFVGQLQ